MSKILASYIDALFPADLSETLSNMEDGFSADMNIRITPCYVLGLALALPSACIKGVSPLPRSDEKKLRRFGDLWTPEGHMVATARMVVPTQHPLYPRALNHDQYSFNVKLVAGKLSLAFDSIGQEVCLPSAVGNWRSARDGTPGWLLATFPQHGYALISPRYLEVEQNRIRSQLN